MGGYPTRFLAVFSRKDPRTPVKPLYRIKNIAINNFRGLLGVLLTLCLLPTLGGRNEPNLTVQFMWLMMFIFFLLQPVNIPVTALIPIFILPMMGVMSSIKTCSCYMNEGIVLFILAGMLGLLLNNTGVDRRLMLWILCSGKNCSFSGKRLVFKCTTAAFILSIFCNKLIVTSTLIQYVAPALINLQSATARYRDTEPCYDRMRYLICNAIQTSSAIGSIAIPHAALATLAFRAMFSESAPAGSEYPDIFNYFQYSVYAFPVALLMFFLNLLYYMILVDALEEKVMTASSMSQMRNAIRKHKSDIPKKMTGHEKLSIFFTLFYLAMFFLRWSKYMDKGWGDFRAEVTSPEIPGVKDATVAALFVIALHMLPKGCGFVNIMTADKKSELKIKTESAILWWRFVDRNLNYGYIFMLGCGVALTVSVRHSGLGSILSAELGKKITDLEWNISILVVCLITVILANSMTGVAACAIWLPFVLNMCWAPDAPDYWQTRSYLGALGVGVGSSLGFIWPFLYTPAYFCHYTGKVPKKEMVKYGLGSALICLIILWLSLCFYAPFLWDPNNSGISWVDAPSGDVTTTTTEGGDATDAGGGDAGDPVVTPDDGGGG